MRKSVVYGVEVQFGDCDPAGIVFFPNYSRWMDAASHHFFRGCGLPPWHVMDALPGCVGPPLLEIHTKFHASASFGDRLEFHTHIEEWRGKVFVQVHRAMRGSTLVCEGRETRVLCVRDAVGTLKSIPIPEFIRSACD